mmetsp:Transcript_54193/g.126581  ORF Transcript_54193/g.126581 Transcript_54193/m.126581 type:complete len:229 (-) Transcript_54193:567-1253(-)
MLNARHVSVRPVPLELGTGRGYVWLRRFGLVLFAVVVASRLSNGQARGWNPVGQRVASYLFGKHESDVRCNIAGVVEHLPVVARRRSLVLGSHAVHAHLGLVRRGGELEGCVAEVAHVRLLAVNDANLREPRDARAEAEAVGHGGATRAAVDAVGEDDEPHVGGAQDVFGVGLDGLEGVHLGLRVEPLPLGRDQPRPFHDRIHALVFLLRVHLLGPALRRPDEHDGRV